MSTNSSLILRDSFVELSITDPETGETPVLVLEHMIHFSENGYKRTEAAGTRADFRYNAFRQVVSSGVRSRRDDKKHEFEFDVILTDAEKLRLLLIYDIAQYSTEDIQDNPYVTIRDRRLLFQERGTGNPTRFLADSPVDNTTEPGAIRYYAGFAAFFLEPDEIHPGEEQIEGIFFSPTAGGTAWRTRFKMSEGEKLT